MIKKLDYNDKFPENTALKLYLNQYEMAEKINEIIDTLNKLSTSIKKE